MSSFVINPYSFTKAFSPADVSGLELWLDASDTTTIFDATSGGNLPADGGDVKRWEDKSGNGRHFTEATSFPTRADAEVNSQNTVRFQGASDFITRTGGTFAQADFDNVFFVSKTADQAYVFLGTNSGSVFLDATQNSAAAPHQGVTVTQFRVNASNVSSTRSALLTARDSSANILSVTGMSGQSSAFSNLRLNYSSGGGFDVSNGYACELLIYSGTLSTADRDDIEQYLADKWGITL